MSYEVDIPQPNGFTRIMVPLDIPTSLIDAQAIELYATKVCGWTPTIIVDGVEVPNPTSAINACAGRIRNFVKEDYKGILANQGAEAGKQQAINAFESAFNPTPE